MSETIQTIEELNVLKAACAIDLSLYERARRSLSAGQPVEYFYAAHRPTRKRPCMFRVTEIRIAS